MPGYEPSPEERVISWVRGNPHARKTAPVRPGAGIALEGFGPVPRGGGWAFNRGMRFTTPASGAEAEALAVGNGSLTFLPATGSEPATLALTLTGIDIVALLSSGMPAWVAPPRALLYRGMDPDGVRDAVEAILRDPARLAAARETHERLAGDATLSAAELAAVLVEHPDRLGDGIPVTVGEAIGTGAAGADGRGFELLVGDPDGSTPIARNPAWYFAFWNLAGVLDVVGHPLETGLLRTEHGLEANGVMRFVAHGGADANAPFTDPALPARTVRAALAAAADGDTVLILDGATYSEPEIVVEKAVNLTSAAALGAGQRHLGGELEDAAAPTPPAGLPVLQGPGSFGGIREDMTGDTAFIPTAGAHRVLRFTVPAGRGVASLTKVVVRHGGAREGGGILVLESGPVVISSCHVHRNVAYFNALFFDPSDDHPHPFPGSGWSQEGFGGGICAYTSSPLIWGNRIDRNLALNGGGIGLFARCFPLIAENYVARNVLPDWFGADTPGDGGGIRVLSLNLRSQTMAMSNLDPRPGHDAIQLWNAFNALFPDDPIRPDQLYELAHIQECQRSWVHLHRNRVLRNVAGDDGGGVYVTGITRLFSSGNRVEENVSRRGDGGGFRVSTASVLRSRGDRVLRNSVQGDPDDGATGGGVAVRCSDCYLLETRVEGNRSHFAGAGLSFTSTREGIVTGTRWLPKTVPSWDAQRTDAFGYSHAVLHIDRTSRIEANVADDGTKGKGGGLYVFRFMRDGEFVADRVTVEIEAAASVLAPSNDAVFSQAGVKPYRRFYLVDQTKEGPAGTRPLVLGDTELATGPADLSHVSL